MTSRNLWNKYIFFSDINHDIRNTILKHEVEINISREDFNRLLKAFTKDVNDEFFTLVKSKQRRCSKWSKIYFDDLNPDISMIIERIKNDDFIFRYIEIAMNNEFDLNGCFGNISVRFSSHIKGFPDLHPKTEVVLNFCLKLRDNQCYISTYRKILNELDFFGKYLSDDEIYSGTIVPILESMDDDFFDSKRVYEYYPGTKKVLINMLT